MLALGLVAAGAAAAQAQNNATINVTAAVQQPIVVNTRLRNVPADGIFNWDPGAQFGIYKPDGFWFDQSMSPSASATLGVQPR